MATPLSLHDYEEDYIDMELFCSSPTTKFCCSPSSQRTREFEFQMSLTINEKESIISPADELFYKGKLLPLHLPRQRQMVENLLHNTTTTTTAISFEEDNYYALSFPKCSTAPCTNTLNTPLGSANISPSESCRVSCELNHDDYFFEWSSELRCFINNQSTKKTWSKKLKLIKNSIIGQKLRASRAYLKTLFSKSTCSDDETCAKANNNGGGDENLPKDDESSSEKYFKIVKRPFGLIGRTANPAIATIMKESERGRIQDNDAHRRSFSSAIKRHSPHKCLSSSSSNSSSSWSSSFSLTSNSLQELHFLRRSSSAIEIESSIEAAIAHCKKSQSILDSRTSSKDPEICQFSASRTTDEEEQKRLGLCST